MTASRDGKAADELTTVADWERAWSLERDAGPNPPPEPFFATVVRTAVAAGGRPVRNVVEIGAGGGTCLLWLRDLLPDARVVGLDYAVGGLRLAADRRAPGSPFPNLVAGRFESPPFAAAAFDLVTSFGLIEHFTGPARLACLAAHRALLAPGGAMLVTAPNHHGPLYRGWYGLARVLERLSPPLARRLSVNIVDEQALSAAELKALGAGLGLEGRQVVSSSAATDLWRMTVQRVLGLEPPAWALARSSRPVAALPHLGNTLALVGTAPR